MAISIHITGETRTCFDSSWCNTTLIDLIPFLYCFWYSDKFWLMIVLTPWTLSSIIEHMIIIECMDMHNRSRFFRGTCDGIIRPRYCSNAVKVLWNITSKSIREHATIRHSHSKDLAYFVIFLYRIHYFFHKCDIIGF